MAFARGLARQTCPSGLEVGLVFVRFSTAFTVSRAAVAVYRTSFAEHRAEPYENEDVTSN